MALGAAAMVALAAASGNFQLPAVAGDTRAGLSADGRTAVLAERPAHGRSRFALVDREARRVRRVISLRGDFGFDALSPDGARIYLIEYRSRDHRRYAVQALRADDASARLETVVEKGEPGERMSGLPITRTTSPGGDWVYTLYDGAGSEPFIHALDTADQFTVCIDLHALARRRDPRELTLALTGNALTVSDATRTRLVRVDTESYEVTTISRRSGPVRRDARTENDGQPPWVLLGASALIAALAVISTRRRRIPT